MFLAEKVGLDCEVTSLRSELQSLKSQAASHSIELAEKLALERNLSSLQQDLENLKRSTQVAEATQKISQLEDERLQNKLRSLQAEIEEERCQRLRTEELFQKASSDWESKKTTLESRSNTFRNKLRITMEQLKACQTELHNVQASRPSEPGPLAGGPGRKGLAKASLKRDFVPQPDADSMIGTPGDMPAAKKTKRGFTLPGDKSTFSITPYLNRASSVALESPGSETDHNTGLRQKQQSYDHLDDQGEPDDAVVFAKSTAQNAQSKTRVIGNRGKSSTKASLMRMSRRSPSLEDVSELEENQNDPLLVDKPKHTVADALKRPKDSSLLHETVRKGIEVQKRKRKVLTGRIRESVIEDARNSALGGGRTGNFGTISPLKAKRKQGVDITA